MSVVEFPSEPRRILVCDCGCSTFLLRVDGEAICANCDLLADPDRVAWFEKVKSVGDRPDDAPAPIEDVQGNGSVEFARARLRKVASAEDAKLIIVARGAGRVHVWSAAESDEQHKWVEEMIEIAVQMLRSRDRGQG